MLKSVTMTKTWPASHRIKRFLKNSGLVIQQCLKRTFVRFLVAFSSRGTTWRKQPLNSAGVKRLVWHFANCLLNMIISYCSTNQPTTWTSTVKKSSKMPLSTTTARFVSCRMTVSSSTRSQRLFLKSKKLAARCI